MKQETNQNNQLKFYAFEDDGDLGIIGVIAAPTKEKAVEIYIEKRDEDLREQAAEAGCTMAELLDDVCEIKEIERVNLRDVETTICDALVKSNAAYNDCLDVAVELAGVGEAKFLTVASRLGVLDDLQDACLAENDFLDDWMYAFGIVK